MKLHELQQQIISKSLDKLYIFYGEEVGIMDVYLNKMYSVIDADVVRVETVQEAYVKVGQKKLSGGPRCFVVRDDKEFFKNDKVWSKVFSLVNSSSDFLILIYSSVVQGRFSRALMFAVLYFAEGPMIATISLP